MSLIILLLLFTDHNKFNVVLVLLRITEIVVVIRVQSVFLRIKAFLKIPNHNVGLNAKERECKKSLGLTTTSFFSFS